MIFLKSGDLTQQRLVEGANLDGKELRTPRTSLFSLSAQ
jgi:hypothetical protein